MTEAAAATSTSISVEKGNSKIEQSMKTRGRPKKPMQDEMKKKDHTRGRGRPKKHVSLSSPDIKSELVAVEKEILLLETRLKSLRERKTSLELIVIDEHEREDQQNEIEVYIS